MDISKTIGKNLLYLRQERSLSLTQLAELADLSRVMLSQIEKGTANPSINTIWKIAGALQVPYTSLLEDREQTEVVVRRSEAVSQPLDQKQGFLYCYYQGTQKRNFELFTMTLNPHECYTSHGHGTNTEEYILVKTGVLELKTDKISYKLMEGDAISFSASSQHTYFNPIEATLEAIIINFYKGHRS